MRSRNASTRANPRTPTTVLSNARATTQAQLGTQRWIDEGGSLGAEVIVPVLDAAASEASYRNARAARAKPTT